MSFHEQAETNTIIFGVKLVRKIKEFQMKLGEIDISQIEFDMRSRDEIPKLLMGLQHIWCTPELRQKVNISCRRLETMLPC